MSKVDSLSWKHCIETIVILCHLVTQDCLVLHYLLYTIHHEIKILYIEKKFVKYTTLDNNQSKAYLPIPHFSPFSLKHQICNVL